MLPPKNKPIMQGFFFKKKHGANAIPLGTHIPWVYCYKQNSKAQVGNSGDRIAYKWRHACERTAAAGRQSSGGAVSTKTGPENTMPLLALVLRVCHILE